MRFAIQDTDTGEILEHTMSNNEEDTWNKYLGFTAVDDQWAWQRQKAEEAGMSCIKIVIKADKTELLKQLDGLKSELYNKWKGTFLEAEIKVRIDRLEKQLAFT